MSLPTPITRSEQYLAKIAGAEPTLPTPITREERYLAKIAGEDVDIPPAPITRTEQYLAAIVEGGGGGGVEVESLSVTENGTYTAEEGKAYSPVNVNVPNTYAAGDEGKVVSNGALVAQTSDSVTENGTFDTTLISSLEVNVPQGGGGEAQEKDVNFIDYDGTILYSYTAQEFAALDALPANPTHEGLTAQGWNWTLADAKSTVAVIGMLDIGQTYKPADGKTHLFVELPNEAFLHPYIGMQISKNGSVAVDWGDGTEDETLSGGSAKARVWSNQHKYAHPGKYEITITPAEGTTIDIEGSSALSGGAYLFSGYKTPQNGSAEGAGFAYHSCVKEIWIGNNVQIGSCAFKYMTGLLRIVLPISVDTYAFVNCGNLSCVVFSDGVTNISNYCFQYAAITKISLSKTITAIGDYAFDNCKAIARIIAPTNVTVASYAFEACSATQISPFENASSVGAQFARQSNIVSTPFTKNSKITQIPTYAFYNCKALGFALIPPLVTAMAASAFSDCAGLSEVLFCPTTPPAAAASNVFNNWHSSCKIYVPYASLAAYLTASNYPSPATYTYIGFATYNSGVTLPTQDSTEAYNVVWYASKDDAIAQTNPITQGNGKEVYCRYTAV